MAAIKGPKTGPGVGRLKMRDRKMRDGQKCRGRKCRTGKCGTNMQGWKMRDNRVWKACLRISVPKLILECKNSIGFSSFDSVVSNSCTICFVFSLIMYFLCVCFLLSLWTYFSEFNGRSYLK